MSRVKKEPSGRHSIEIELEVPGTPEQVWTAIATGPGISSWFVPSEVETREGGAVAFHLGPGMDSTGHVTAWEPPRRFAYEEPGWNGNAPPLATEFIVEARAGGSCTVRIVHSLFSSTDDWDDQIDGMESGWRAFFRVLRVYLEHPPGMHAASVRPTVSHAGSHEDAWRVLKDRLGLSNVVAGETCDTSRHGAPRLVGIVEAIEEHPDHCEVTLRLTQPAPGVAMIGTYEWDKKAHIVASLYFYGENADAVSARESQVWNDWLAQLSAQDAGRRAVAMTERSQSA